MGGAISESSESMDEETKALNRLTISRQDFEKCNDFLLQLQSQDYGSIVYEALLLSAIVFYSRPFSHNERDQNATADAKIDQAVLIQLTDEDLLLHQKILTLRNKAIAHAEAMYYPTRVLKKNLIRSMPFSIWNEFKNSSDIEEFLALVRKVLRQAIHLTFDKLRNLPS